MPKVAVTASVLLLTVASNLPPVLPMTRALESKLAEKLLNVFFVNTWEDSESSACD